MGPKSPYGTGLSGILSQNFYDPAFWPGLFCPSGASRIVCDSPCREHGSCLAKTLGAGHDKAMEIKQKYAGQVLLRCSADQEARRYGERSIPALMPVFSVKISALTNGFAIFADINVISHLHNRPEGGI
jgi:hypothetical protein